MKHLTRILIAAFILSFHMAGTSAQAQTRREPRIPLPIDPLGLNKQPTSGDLGFDITKALDAKLLPDLQYALKLAQATNSQVTAPCYQAWIDMINTQTTAVQTKNADGTTTELAIPDPHVITDFERLVELRNALQPESKFMISCSPVASMIKTDILGFMAKVVGGGAALTTLIPGL